MPGKAVKALFFPGGGASPDLQVFLGAASHSCFLLIAEIEEKGVRMKLTVIDTPGFGDHINNENW